MESRWDMTDESAGNGRIRVITRKSALARKQTELAVSWLRHRLPAVAWSVEPVSSQGDERLNWSLEKAGGSGLFTSVLEAALLEGAADVAVHSAKDLPTQMDAGLELAGYLRRGPAQDVLLLRDGVLRPRLLATSSPRRRAQMKAIYPDLAFREVRGNVETRLRKVAEGKVDGTVMAAAGLVRLGIESWPGLRFLPLSTATSVPAAGQGAIALQTRAGEADWLRGHLCERTAVAVERERCFLRAMGGGCHAATAAFWSNGILQVYDDRHGYGRLAVAEVEGLDSIERFARQWRDREEAEETE